MTRVSKFVQGHNPDCTLCKLSNEQLPRQAEPFSHIFFSCAYSGKIRVAVENKFFSELVDADTTIRKNFWFLSALPTNRGTEFNEFISAVVATTNYLIWTAKLQKIFLPINVILIDLEWKIRKMLSISKKLEASKQNSNSYICRYDFFREGGRGVP
jgi:hypothetical protein